MLPLVKNFSVHPFVVSDHFAVKILPSIPGLDLTHDRVQDVPNLRFRCPDIAWLWEKFEDSANFITLVSTLGTWERFVKKQFRSGKTSIIQEKIRAIRCKMRSAFKRFRKFGNNNDQDAFF